VGRLLRSSPMEKSPLLSRLPFSLHRRLYSKYPAMAKRTMQTIYRLTASKIVQRFIEGLKATFQDREIEVVVYEVDETAYMRASQPNHDRLLQAVNNAVNNIDRHTDLVESG